MAQRPLKRFQSIESIFSVNERVILMANDGILGQELWVSDGTMAGTQLLKDHDSPTGYGSTEPGATGNAVVMNGFLYYKGRSAAQGSELWKTDGTPEGTTMVIDLQPNEPNPTNPSYVNYSSEPYPLLTFKNRLYFLAQKPHTGTIGIFRTDGTAAGTNMFNNYSYNYIKATTDYLYLADACCNSFYRTDGTTPITKITIPDTGGEEYVRAMVPGIGGIYVLVGNSSSSTNFARLYFFNEGTSTFDLLKDLSGTEQVEVKNFTVSGNKLYFSVGIRSSPGTEQLWVSDATAAGTTMLVSRKWDSYVSNDGMSAFSPYQNGLVFMYGSYDKKGVWFSDGTTAGTRLVTELTMAEPREKRIPTAVAGDFYYVSRPYYYSSAVVRIMAINNTSLTPTLNLAFNQFADANSDFNMTAAGNKVYFTGNDGYGLALWSLDPAPEINVLSASSASLKMNAAVGVGAIKVDSCANVKVTIESIGRSDLLISSVSTTSKDWSLNKTTIPGALKPSEKLSLQLNFNPVAEGYRPGSLIIQTNDPNEFNYTLLLQGEGKGLAVRGCRVDTVAKVTEIKTASVITGITPEQSSVDCSPTFEELNFGVRSVAINSKGTMFMAGTAGVLTYSLDNGVSWKRKQLPKSDYGPDSRSTTIEFIGKLGILYSQYGGYIMRSEDDGDTWNRIARSPDGTEMMYASFFSETSGFGIDQNKRIYSTKDGGKSWTGGGWTTFETSQPLAINETTVIALGSTNFKKSIDAGKTWTIYNLPGPLSGWYARDKRVWFVNADNWWVLTQSGIYETLNGGGLWYKRGTPPTGEKMDIISVSDDAMLISLGYGIYKSTDKGATWQVVATIGCQAVAIKGNVVIASQYSPGSTDEYGRQISTSNDGGKTWTSRTRIPSAYDQMGYSSISFQTEDVGYLVAVKQGSDYYSLLKTLDGDFRGWKLRRIGNLPTFISGTRLSVLGGSRAHCIRQRTEVRPGTKYIRQEEPVTYSSEIMV